MRLKEPEKIKGQVDAEYAYMTSEIPALSTDNLRRVRKHFAWQLRKSDELRVKNLPKSCIHEIRIDNNGIDIQLHI